MNVKLSDSVRRIIELLVTKQYDAAANLTSQRRLDSKLIQTAIEEYGRTLSSPPQMAYENLDAILVKGSSPQRWSVRFDLWTLEEGRSDLSIMLTLIENDDDCSIEIDGILVL